jgi:DNA replication protein DnaC
MSDYSRRPLRRWHDLEANVRRIVTWEEAVGDHPWPDDAEIARRLAAQAVEDAAEAERQRIEAEHQREERALGAAASTVPSRCWNTFTSKDFIETAAVREVRRWYASDETMLVLGGAVGTGKTTACVVAVLEETRRRGYPMWVQAYRLSHAAGYSDDAREEWEKLTTRSLLIIDDLGASFVDGKGWSAGALDALLGERYAAELATIITTNCDAAAFRSLVGERVTDRVREAGAFFLVPGSSLRGKAR